MTASNAANAKIAGRRIGASIACIVARTFAIGERVEIACAGHHASDLADRGKAQFGLQNAAEIRVFCVVQGVV